METRRTVLAGAASVLAVLGLSGTAHAQCTFAGGAADGMNPVSYFVSSGTASPLSHAFGVTTGRSYSIEARSVAGGGFLTMFTNSSFCPSTDIAGLRDTVNISPHCPGCGQQRVSYISTITGFLESKVTTTAAGGITYIFKVADTTLFSPAWSTNGTFDTFYSFYNTSNGTCTGTLTLANLAGGTVQTTPVSINSLATTSINTSSLGTTRNLTGTARLAHDCPPGAILAEAAVANFTLSPTPYIQIVKFEAVREQH